MFLEQWLFPKWSNINFDCKLDTPGKKVLPEVQIELKKLGKIQLRADFFPQIFQPVYCKLVVECKTKEILLEHLRKCEKKHFQINNVDGIALNWLFKSFFLHVFKVCEKEVFHFKKLKDLENCLIAKTYAPFFLKNHLQENFTAQNNSGIRLFFCFCIHVWMRSKSHQHRSCNFRQMIGNCVYISNRCSLTLREEIEKTRMLSTNLWNPIGSFTEIFRRESNLL